MNNDLISREALKKKFERLVDETIPYGGVAVNDMRELIDNAPTVEIPTELCKGCRFLKDCETCEEKLRPQGRWGESFEHLGYTYHKCSNCCFGIKISDYDNFCPNCGAKMKGGAE